MKRQRQKQAKLSPEIVRIIRINRHGKTYKKLAEEFNVSIVTVQRAAWHVTWRQVP